MKNTAIVKFILAAGLVAGMQTALSCDSCNRNKDTEENPMEEGRVSDSVTNSDTQGATGTTQSNAYSTGTTAQPAGTGGGSVNTTTSTTGSTATDPNNDPIENTNMPARKKNGEAVDSGGSAGSGMGTGTGSTGNNSRVRTAEDQRD